MSAAGPGLPAPHDADAPYAVALVCLGNICRSPMAEVVLRDRLQRRGMADAVQVQSAGTGDWHVGQGMDARAARTLSRAGYDGSRHRARTVTPGWLGSQDLVLVMDHENLQDVLAAMPPEADPDRVRMFRRFDPDSADDADVPDPWYGGYDGFADVLAVIERTSDALAAALADTVSTGR
ncbi:MAG TPA: low molecular weight protein-tyrosine-phosphatase [Nocardioidaceae bacterium]|nr:low molecular weight protein-tyrosine-phosphatase [Nocardioidaceae bacterium]